MKHQDLLKIHQQSVTELQDSLKDLLQKLSAALTERRFGKGKNAHATISLRHDIARIKTILSAKLLVQSTSPQKEKTV